jgi:hypothetical protein
MPYVFSKHIQNIFFNKAKEYLIKQVLPYWVADEESKKLIDDAL